VLQDLLNITPSKKWQPYPGGYDHLTSAAAPLSSAPAQTAQMLSGMNRERERCIERERERERVMYAERETECVYVKDRERESAIDK
jgi:hypothetical protein